MTGPRGLPAWREARALLWRERRLVGLGLVAVLINRLAALALPVSAKLVIDGVIGQRRTGLLLPIAVAAGAAILVEAATAFVLSQAGALAGQRTIARLRRRLQAHALRLPVAFFDSSRTGTMVSRIMGDAEQLRTLVGAGAVQLVSGGLTAALALIVLFAVDWRLTALVFALVLLVAIGLTTAVGGLQSRFRCLSEGQAELTSRLAETLGGIRVVKSYVAERREEYAFARAAHRLVREALRAGTGVSALISAIALATGGVSLVLLVLGGHAVAAGAMTLGDLALYVFLVGLLGTPLIQAAAIGSELGRAFAALGRIREFLDLPTEEIEDRGRVPLSGMVGTVVFDRVSYAYVPGRLALRQVSFRAAAGTTTALVGRSGAGKSTLCRLLLAFDQPTSGRILIDGRDLALLRRRDYRRRLGVVLQDDVLFDGTVADNIRYGCPEAGPPALRRAARLAHCDEFVEMLPDGYDTVVGERGVKLSGGQRQRVAIARALLADPRILILDEATSHLDAKSEVLVQDGLRALRSGRTTFVIAHRRSTIETADQVILLERGEVVEGGKGGRTEPVTPTAHHLCGPAGLVGCHRPHEGRPSAN